MVVVAEVLGDQLQAVVAAGDLMWAVGVDGQVGSFSAERSVAWAVVDYVLLRRIRRPRPVVVIEGIEVCGRVVVVPARVSKRKLGVREQGV